MVCRVWRRVAGGDERMWVAEQEKVHWYEHDWPCRASSWREPVNDAIKWPPYLLAMMALLEVASLRDPGDRWPTHGTSCEAKVGI